MSERRTLLVAERVVPASQREQYILALRDKQSRCEEVGVHFWAFVHELDVSRYLEFAEAKDAAKLDALDLDLDASGTSRWHAVELS